MRGFSYISAVALLATATAACFSNTNGDGIGAIAGINGHEPGDAAADSAAGYDAGAINLLFDAATGGGGDAAACTLSPNAFDPSNQNCGICLASSPCCEAANTCFASDGGLSTQCSAYGTCLAGCANGQLPDGGTFPQGVPDSGNIASCDKTCAAIVPATAVAEYTAYMACFNASSCTAVCNE